jgi:hypothetical protein
VILRDQRDVQLRLDKASAMPIEFEVGIPGHCGDRALEEGVRVVKEARMPRVLDRGEPAAGDRARSIDSVLSPAFPRYACRIKPLWPAPRMIAS